MTVDMDQLFPGKYVLTADDVAEALDVSSMTVYRAVKAGELEAVKVGKRSIRTTRDDVLAWLNRSTPEPAAKAETRPRRGRKPKWAIR